MQLQPQINYINCLNNLGESYRMYYSSWGNPEASKKHMLCIHGLNRNNRDWDYVGAYFAMQGYYVVCPDIVGRGLSSNLVNYTGYNIPSYIADVLNLIRTLSLNNIDFVGTSMGGMIGMGLASLPQNSLRSMVLNDIGAEIEYAGLARIMSYSSEQLSFDTLAEAKASLVNTSKDFGDMPDTIWQEMAQNSYQKNSLGKYELKRDMNIAKTFALLFQVNDAFKAEISIAELTKLTTNMTAKILPQNITMWDIWNKIINLPTLIIRGETSDILSVSVMHKMCTSRDNVQSVTIANAGHAPFLYTDEHMTILSKFFK